MRIISGNLKGKSIKFFKSNTTRPLKDSVKENIFNIIIHSKLFNINLFNSNILDLFSGIGSFGLECISRGAKKIIFVEKNEKAAEILNKNLAHLAVQNKADIVKDDIINFLNDKITLKFEIIFLDPPFKKNDYIEDLQLLRKKKIYKKNHIVIIHRESKSQEDIEKIIKPLIIKQYGRSKIIFGEFL
jgi:16S rRNA (guanine966-N2)-methyltransferase